MIANRLEPALNYIISDNQRGFRKGKRICCNIRMAYELIKFAEANKIEGIILSLDFEKCFDKVSFEVLFGALHFFKFPKYIIDWITILYTDFEVNIQNNGHFSGRIQIQQGLHQGGPCSSLLFLICAEILALLLKNDRNIEGIPVDDIMNLLGQYADDADIYLIKSQKALDSVFLVLERFKSMSGFTLNYDKTALLRIGSLKNTDSTLLTKQTVAWTNEPINVLGVWVSTDLQQGIKKNYDEIYTKVKSTLKRWQHRRTSLFGKIMLINSLITSLFIYKMMALPMMSQEMESRIKSDLTKFLWNNAKPKIAYDTLIQPKGDGGGGLIDLGVKNKALKLSWISILNDEPDLSNVVYANFAPVLKEKIWKCSLTKADIKLIIDDPFWKEVLEAWSTFKVQADQITKYDTQLIWFNSAIRVSNMPVLWERPFKKGLLYVGQLYRNGELISKEVARNEFDLSVLSLNAIASALPKEMRQYARKKSSTDTFVAPVIDFVSVMRKRKDLSSFAYKFLIKPKTQCSLISRWSKELNKEVQYDQLSRCFREVFLTTNIPKYRSFQFRLLHRAIVTNIHLHRWGKLDSNLCSFCGKEPETYSHLFVLCDNIKQLWIGLEREMYKFNDQDINFGVDAVLNNKLVPNPRNVKNFICLLFKQYIYRQRCIGDKLNLEKFIFIVNSSKNIERYIAVKNGNERKYRQKWSKDISSYHEQDLYNCSS